MDSLYQTSYGTHSQLVLHSKDESGPYIFMPTHSPFDTSQRPPPALHVLILQLFLYCETIKHPSASPFFPPLDLPPPFPPPLFFPPRPSGFLGYSPGDDNMCLIIGHALEHPVERIRFKYLDEDESPAESDA